MKRVAVGDVMTRNFVSVKPDTNLLKCSKEMVKNRVNSLIIVQDGRLKGILTATDILWAITKKPSINLTEIRSIDISTRKVAVIKPSSDIGQALMKMKAYNFRRLPVLSKGNIIGVITLKDILKVNPDLYANLGELVEIREETRKLKQAGEKWPSEGLCENCGAFSELLKVYDQLLCPDCREDLY